MKITQEQADRLRQNLVFDNTDKTDIQGAITILFRGETQESMTELYSLLQGLLANSDWLVGMEIELPEFRAEIGNAPENSSSEPVPAE
jgi:hypothetical protein